MGPVELMKKFGVSEVTRLVKDYAMHYNERNPLVKETKWHMDIVTLRKEGNRAVITMNRPEDLNALNEEVISMLDEKFSEAESDPAIQTIFMVGSGKAFVAGADIKFFVKNIKNNSLDKIEAFAAYGQKVFKKIDSSSKKVVAVLNGMTLGGGLELALCADVILSVPKTIMAFPETGIGIYPGLGGTQRCAERIGKGLAKFLILTGRTLKANEAFEIGLVDAVLPVWEIFRIIDGTKMLPQPVKVQLTGKWKDYESLYAGNSYQNIINGNYSNGHLEKGEVQQLGAVMSHKAPVAMQLAEELIEAGRGPQSEIEKMNVVFSTSDALLGLTNIGKRVTYTGK